jgi:DNA processing protein
VTSRDLVALSLLPVRHRRSALSHVLRELEIDVAHPCPDLLDRAIAVLDGLNQAPEARATVLRDQADALLKAAAAASIDAVSWVDARYPPLLRRIVDPPVVLWVRGDPVPLAGRAVAIVGSRGASPYGLSVAERLGHDLAEAGVTVVSGMARGCDGAAHRGALSAGGATIAVLGCGPDIVYPAEHRNLYRTIVEKGAVLSELGPGAPPLPAHFPRRNRIISGLVAAVVVVEASARSGSLITAECALEQGRDVMAVPGNVLSERHTGCHELVRDGACLVQSANDVLAELGWDRPVGNPGDGASPEAPADAVLACLAPGEDCDVDTLAQRAGLSAAALLEQLTRLELLGSIQRTAGGRLVRSGR